MCRLDYVEFGSRSLCAGLERVEWVASCGVAGEERWRWLRIVIIASSAPYSTVNVLKFVFHPLFFINTVFKHEQVAPLYNAIYSILGCSSGVLLDHHEKEHLQPMTAEVDSTL